MHLEISSGLFVDKYRFSEMIAAINFKPFLNYGLIYDKEIPRYFFI